MAPTHPSTENSAAGLVLLDAQHTVAVTGEEHHQDVLCWYAPQPGGPPRQFAVELGFAPISRGQHAGERGIGVWLDGRRVGELTHRMAQRYGPVVEDVLRTGRRPGCLARIVAGQRKIEVELRLPGTGRAGTPLPPPSRRSAGAPGSRRPPNPAPPAGPPPGRNARRRAPYWIGGGVAALLLIIGTSVGDGDRNDASTTTTVAAPTTAPQRTTTAPTRTVEPEDPDPTTSARRTSSRPAARAAPEPDAPRTTTRTSTRTTTRADTNDDTSGCHPSYSGCLPVTADVDCPEVNGPVQVRGPDVYRLDRDKDGIACE